MKKQLIKILTSLLLVSVVVFVFGCPNPHNGGNDGTVQGNEWVKIPGGTYEIGCSSGESNETVHEVSLSEFYICNHEVTIKDWLKVFTTFKGWGSSTEGPQTPSGEIRDNLPVTSVSWYAAIAYCNRLSLKDGLTPCYSVKDASNNEIDWKNLNFNSIPTEKDQYWDNATCDWSANGYRLPTESEWEVAARGGISDTFSAVYAGTTEESKINEYAWCNDWIHGVKQKKPNGYGLYDMSGNVNKWCWDWYGTYPSGAVSDPRGAANGTQRVVRGGYFNSNLSGSYDELRVSYRSGALSPKTVNLSTGFRLVRSKQ